MKIVVIGSGCAGLECVKHLNGKADIEWISREHFMTKKWDIPTLLTHYGDELKKRIIVDIPNYIKSKNIRAKFVLDEINEIDTKNKKLIGSKKEYTYDKLIIATGSASKLPRFEIEDKRNVSNFDVLDDFLFVAEKLKKAKNISLVGAGPIGFEMSLRLSPKYNVTLIEHDSDVMLHFLMNYPFYRFVTRKLLEFRGVKIHLYTGVCKVTKKGVVCMTLDGSERFMESDLVICSVGVRQNVPKIDGEDFDKDRILFCDDFGEAFVHERGGHRRKLHDVYAVGDATHYLRKKNYPSSAIFAEKAARIVAHNILEKNKKSIRYHPSLYYRIIDTVLKRIFF